MGIILCFLTLWAFLFWTPSSSSCHNFGRLFVVNINLKSTSISSTLIEFDFTLSYLSNCQHCSSTAISIINVNYKVKQIKRKVDRDSLVRKKKKKKKKGKGGRSGKKKKKKKKKS